MKNEKRYFMQKNRGDQCPMAPSALMPLIDLVLYLSNQSYVVVFCIAVKEIASISIYI